VLGVSLFPWQKWLLIHALELRAEGGFRFRNVVVLVARQNGKSTLSQVLALWFMYVYGYDLVLGTAQDLDTAEEVWQGAVDLVTEVDEDDQPLRPELFELHKRTVLVNGKKTLELKTGARYKAKAASRRSGRGLSGDLVMLDELREHQTWDAWGAITKTTMARDEAMIWALSNAGDRLSVVLSYLRRMAHAALGDPDGINALGGAAALLAGEADAEDMELEEDDDSLGIFEWSAPPGCDVMDRDGWAMANPSLGHKISERTIASAARTDPEAIFRTEVLCQWVDAMEASILDLRLWGALGIGNKTPAAPVLSVEVALDRSRTTVGAAWRIDGKPHVEVFEDIEGTDVAARLAELSANYNVPTVVLDGGTEAASLIPALEQAGLTVLKLSGAERAAACGSFFDLAATAGLSHNGDPALATALGNARWKDVGEGARVFSRRKSAGSIAELYAVTLALHGLSVAQPPREFWGAFG
jgi:phage terminase large subunit-like protein